MDPSRGDSRYNLNYSMSSIGLSLADQTDIYGNPGAAAALGGRPPSGGLIQPMGGGSTPGGGGGGGGGRTGGSNLMSNSSQCQSLSNTGNASGGGNGGGGQSRGIKRSSSDCYDDHHRGGSGSGGMTSQSLQGLESCAGGGSGNGTNPVGQQGNVPDVVDDSYTSLQNKKSPPANGKKTKGRVKIKMEYIDNKLRRYTTFSKRKTGIMKKAYELSTLTGTQVMLLVASETGHVYTFATRKLQPMITSEAGKQLIQTCLNSPDPPSVGGGDQRMSATGFEETELSYNIADEDSKDDRSPMSSGNESDESSDVDSPGPPSLKATQTLLTESPPTVSSDAPLNSQNQTKLQVQQHQQQQQQQSVAASSSTVTTNNEPIYYDVFKPAPSASSASASSTSASNQNQPSNIVYPASALANIPQEVLLGLIQSGHLQLHTEEDGSGHQYITIPLSMAAAAATNNIGGGSSTQVTDLSSSSTRANASRAVENAASSSATSTAATLAAGAGVAPSSSTSSSLGNAATSRDTIRVKKEFND
ncbi:serum response factor homolog [Eupeodes corollae]|uniref:serum response factor homolog n=1 Tax=Eupeodes corollae TaxID=290404 RepID=UPI0024906F31|nr:serum response factor homolog [Eupeodes corollae]